MKRGNMEYVLHDGKLIPINDLVFMAKSSGMYNIAEHYIISIFVHILSYNKPELIESINEIREYYKFAKYTNPQGAPASGGNMPKKNSMWNEVRSKYLKMSEGERVVCLKECLSLLIADNATLFSSKMCWIGVYLVIRDRLQGRLTATDFYDFANKICPANWPVNKMIGESTMSNMSHKIDYEDRELAYFDMKHNPWKELCECFENIIIQEFLTI